MIMYQRIFIKKEMQLTVCYILIGLSRLAIPQSDTVTSDTLRDRAQQNVLDRRKADEKIQQEAQEAASWLEKSENLLKQLNETHEMAVEYFKDYDGLLHSEQGRAVAGDRAQNYLYFVLTEYPPLELDDLKLKINEASSYVDQIKDASKDPNVGYVPNLDVCDAIEKLEAWSENKHVFLLDARAALDGMLQFSPSKPDYSDDKTLYDAVADLRALPLKRRAKGHELGVEDAEPEVISTFRESTYIAELERALVMSQVQLEEERQKTEQIRKESEIRIIRLETDLKERYVRAEEDRNDMIALLDDLKKDRELKRIIEQKEAERKRSKMRENEERKALRAKAESKRVHDVLAPFFAKAYYQHRMPTGSYEKQPVSLSRLKELGALNRDVYGLRMLNAVATDRNDKDRPRWPFHEYYIKLNEEEKDYVKEAHEYLLELGPILVEEEYLAP